MSAYRDPGAPGLPVRPLQPTYTPHACVILAIDPGEVSGFAIFAYGVPKQSGIVRARDSLGRNFIVGSAVEMARSYKQPLVVVAEKWPLRVSGGAGWRPAGAPRESWGMWLVAINDAAIPKRRIVRVQVGQWSAAILGNRQLKTEARRARSIALAKSRFGRVASHDEAAAICVGLWASHAPEVGKALPKRRAQKGRAA